MPTIAESPRRRGPGRWRGGWLVVLAAWLPVAGCSNSAAEQLAAYRQATAAVDREREVLRNMRIEFERLLGERQMHDFEGSVWSGQVVPHQALGLDLVDKGSDDAWLARFVYHKMPLGWPLQLDRLMALDSPLLPWYHRFEGDVYRTKVAARYNRVLAELNDRMALQQDRVRNAEEYARILKPDGVE